MRTWWQFSEPQWFAFCAIGFLYLYGGIGKIEGAIWPAAAPMTVERLEFADGGKSTLVYGHSERLRPNCNFRGIKWYKGERLGRDVPTSVTLGPPILRRDGRFSFGPWKVDGVQPPFFYSASYSDVYHKCKVTAFGSTFELPWMTVSPFWN